MRTGETSVEEVPAPGLTGNSVLIQTRASLISAGTERMLVEFGKGSLIAKARSQPDKVKQVLDKIKTDGLMPTLEAVFNKLDEPLPLGYCNAGVVMGVGPGVTEFAPGDRVISNGPHAEIVAVPKALCAKIPDAVTDEQAAFTVLASIGLQGIRLAEPSFGETVTVVGMGLIGLVTTQLLIANGCRVIGTDVDEGRLAMAAKYGAQTVNVAQGGDPVVAAKAATNGKGVDTVLITASAKTDEIVHQAAEMCRQRGRIVLVGVVGLNLRRSDFYKKELSFQVSCSYGPGRYDDGYEQGGRDYPYGFVRWTEQRNFQAILEAMESGKLRVEQLITDRYEIADAPAAYEKISADRGTLGVVIQYPAEVDDKATITFPHITTPADGQAVVGLIGAGNFSKMTLMPALAKIGAHVEYIADLNPAAAQHLASKFNISKATSDYKQMLADDKVNAVMIAVRHNLHSRFVIETLEAGKHVFVEKPLALNVQQLSDITRAAQQAGKMVVVGFNRRFSPHALKMKQLLAGRSEPLSMHMTMNAGLSAPDSWVNNPEIGGGRIIGEACHLIDLMVYLAGSRVKTVSAAMAGGSFVIKEDKMVISLGFQDGSVGSVNYFGNGSKSYPKEKMEVYSEGRVLDLDNFRVTKGYGFKGFRKFKTSRQDKGHSVEFAEFVNHVASGGESPIPFEDMVNVTLATFGAMTSAAENRTIIIDQEYASAWE